MAFPEEISNLRKAHVSLFRLLMQIFQVLYNLNFVIDYHYRIRQVLIKMI